MKSTKEKVNLDEILKSLFSSSDKVLINLLNGIFDEDFKEDEVSISIANNEFIGPNFDVIIGDRFFEKQLLFMQILKCAHQKFNARDAHQHTGEFQQIR